MRRGLISLVAWGAAAGAAGAGAGAGASAGSARVECDGSAGGQSIDAVSE